MFLFIIVIVCILLSVANKIYTKVFIKEVDPFSMLFVTNLVLSVLALPVIILNFDKVYLITNFGWAVMIFTCALWSLNGFLGNYTYKVAPVSIREPLSQVQIIFAVFIGVLFFAETPSLFSYFGILLIFIAGLILTIGKHVNREEVNLHIILSVMAMALIAAITTAFDKYTMNFIDPQVYIFFNFAIASLFLSLALSRYRIKLIKEVLIDKAKLFKMFLLSVLFGSSFYLSLLLYRDLDFSIIYPILKTTAPLTAFAGILFLGEKNNWKIKVLSVLIAFVGVVIIKLF